MGGRSIAWLNSRDRNMLGFRRDLLAAAAYGVDKFLFVYGDKPRSGSRTGELNVRAMIEEVRTLPKDPAFAATRPFHVGTAAALRPLPAWKRAADFIFVQVSFSVEVLLRWREANPVDVPVYAGVMVLASEPHVRRLAAAIPDIDVPAELVKRVAADRFAGVEAACEQVLQIRDSGAFDGVHLVPVARLSGRGRPARAPARLIALADSRPERWDAHRRWGQMIGSDTVTGLATCTVGHG